MLSTNGGQFNDIVIVNGEIVFRFPRSVGEPRELRRQAAVLRAVQGRVSIPVPNPIYVDLDSGHDRQPFMGYPMLAGEPLWAETVARIADGRTLDRPAAQLGAFLRELHALFAEELGTAFPGTGDRTYPSALYDAFSDEVFPLMRPDALAEVAEAFERFLDEPSNFRYRPCLVHGDFGGGNILYDPAAGEITGVLDFDSAGLGDPAMDLAALEGYGESFLDRLRPVYPDLLEPAARERARFYRSTFALQQALWARRWGDTVDFEDGIAPYI